MAVAYELLSAGSRMCWFATTRSRLRNKSAHFVIVERRKLATFVVGAPHHAPEGVTTLPCESHPDADENTGHLARYLAEALGAASVIATNARIDPNKSLDTEYSRAILGFKPKLVVEIHGHGGKKARADVEISCGRKEHEAWSQRVAESLRQGIASRPTLEDVAISGTWSEIYFKATSAVTLSGGSGRIGIHIELPPKLRKQGKPGSTPPKSGFEFCDVLVPVLHEVFRELAGRSDGAVGTL